MPRERMQPDKLLSEFVFIASEAEALANRLDRVFASLTPEQQKAIEAVEWVPYLDRLTAKQIEEVARGLFEAKS